LSSRAQKKEPPPARFHPLFTFFAAGLAFAGVF
jgi:hypothetical protein